MRVSWPSLLALALAACGGSDPTPAASTDSDAHVEPSPDTSGDSAAASDTGSATPSDAGGDTGSGPSTDASGDGSGTADAPTPSCTTSCATLSGKVMRVALTKPQNGGKGSVYVAVFDKDPVTDRAGAKLVGQTKIENCDLTADAASVPYSIAALPPRADPYFVVAFLDDNKNAGGATPGPDKGDLVSLDGLAAPKVTLPKGGATVTLDIPLNAVLPF